MSNIQSEVLEDGTLFETNTFEDGRVVETLVKEDGTKTTISVDSQSRALAYTDARIPPYAPHAGAYLVFF